MLLRQSVSPVAQQLLCACITADMRMHNSCCACVAQLLYTNYCPDLWHPKKQKKGMHLPHGSHPHIGHINIKF